jgi:cell wall-associated NlpC family hydrolase
MADALTRVDIAPDAGAMIVVKAGGWWTTPYAPDTPTDQYKGAGAVKGVAADCSGSVWKIYSDAGYRYDYKPSGAFDLYARMPSSPFRKLDDNEGPQSGDIVLYRGHMSIYAGNKSIWSAHKPGKQFDKFPLLYFPLLLGYYRYQIYAPAPGV